MEKQAINDYVRSLDYVIGEALNVVSEENPQALPDRTKNDKGVIICTNRKKEVTIDAQEISILSPANGVIFPGALILGNGELAAGKPTAITLDRAPIKLRVDLPDYNGVIQVKDPKNSTVELAIDKAVSEWHKTVGANGQDIVARMSKEIKKADSTSQLAIDLGFNIKWASNEVRNQLRYEKDTNKTTAVAFFKQVYYTVTVDLPSDPAAVFAESVTLKDVKTVAYITRDESNPTKTKINPPAYVKSVDYGRIIMMRMDTSHSHSKTDVENALKIVTSGGKEINADSKTKIQEIINNSSITVLVLGGGARIASEAFEPNSFDKIPEIIKKGATLNKENPAFPISYTVNFLKDHQLAVMKMSTNYIETECIAYPAGFIELVNGSGCITNFKVTWDEVGEDGKKREGSFNSGDKNNGYKHRIYLQGDTTNIRIIGKAAVFIKTWKEVLNVVEYGPTNSTYAIRGSIGKLRKDITPN